MQSRGYVLRSSVDVREGRMHTQEGIGFTKPRKYKQNLEQQELEETQRVTTASPHKSTNET
jgi:hypothetical protein